MLPNRATHHIYDENFAKKLYDVSQGFKYIYAKALSVLFLVYNCCYLTQFFAMFKNIKNVFK